MKVLYSFPQSLGAPGVGTTAANQIAALRERGHSVTVFSTSVHGNCPSLGRVNTTMVLGPVRIPHKVMGVDRTMAMHDRIVADHLRRNPSAYDVVHCWPGASLLTAGVANALRVPALREVPNTHTANAYEVVNELCEQLDIKLPAGHSHCMNIARLRREEAEYEACHRLLVPSPHVFATFTARGFPPEKLLQHQYGYDPHTFEPSNARADHSFHAVFLGTVEPRKGLHIALEAWRRSRAYRSARLTIYGRVVEEYRSIVAGYFNLPNVEPYDFTAEPAKVLQSADALLLPSYEEGSALVTYEAQGCGAIPLVSKAAGARCVHGATGLIHEIADVDMLAEHINSLRASPALLRKMRKNVLSERHKLTWAAAGVVLEQCYDDAIASIRPAAYARSATR